MHSEPGTDDGVGSESIPLHDAIARLVAQAEQLCQAWLDAPAQFDAGWDDLRDAVEALDERAGSGLAIGKYLSFDVADGEARYIVQKINKQTVQCVWLASPDDRQADAVDEDGWCLRSVAERQIRRREGWV